MILIGRYKCIVVPGGIGPSINPIMHGLSVSWVESGELTQGAFLSTVDICGLHEDICLRVVFGDEVVLVDETALEDLTDISVLEETGSEQIRGVLKVGGCGVEVHDCLGAASAVAGDTQHEKKFICCLDCHCRGEKQEDCCHEWLTRVQVKIHIS